MKWHDTANSCEVYVKNTNPFALRSWTISTSEIRISYLTSTFFLLVLVLMVLSVRLVRSRTIMSSSVLRAALTRGRQCSALHAQVSVVLIDNFLTTFRATCSVVRVLVTTCIE